MARQPPKCCCCVPLRPGLLAWAYIRLILVLTNLGTYLYYNWSWLEYIYRRGPAYFSPSSLLTIVPIPASLVFLLFTIIFIIGVHRENSKLLITFLVYSIFEVILMAVAVVWYLYYIVDDILSGYHHSQHYYDVLHDYTHTPSIYLQIIVPVVVNILMPIYFMVLIKSELKRLKISRVVLDQSIAIEQDKRHNLSYIH